MQTFSSDSFFYNPDTQTMSADISDLSNGRSNLVFGQVFSDACDEGFSVVSSKTGKTIRFTVTNIDMHDGDLRFWELTPVRRDMRSVSNRHDLKIILFNT